jgi:thioredoxin reductase
MGRSHTGMTTTNSVDTVVLGGGPAGATAALVLARARHSVLVADDHSYRNATVNTFHGFPTRDHTSPADYRTEAHRELRGYGVELIPSVAIDAKTSDNGVVVTFADSSVIDAKCVVIATGVRDDLPAIDGLAVRWGRSAFNCPFCDGWEHRDQPVVVIDAAPGADHLASMVRSWTSKVTMVPADEVIALEGPGVGLEQVVLRDGSRIAATAAFVKAPVTPRNDIAHRLGCALDAEGFVLTDTNGRTSSPRVWAAGDIRRSPPAPHQVVLAAADGSAAAIAIHKAHVAGELSLSGDLVPENQHEHAAP